MKFAALSKWARRVEHRRGPPDSRRHVSMRSGPFLVTEDFPPHLAPPVDRAVKLEKLISGVRGVAVDTRQVESRQQVREGIVKQGVVVERDNRHSLRRSPVPLPPLPPWLQLGQ